MGTHEKRFLNSDGFIGYASDVYELISSVDIEDGETDQLFYTQIFLDSLLRVISNILGHYFTFNFFALNSLYIAKVQDKTRHSFENISKFKWCSRRFRNC